MGSGIFSRTLRKSVISGGCYFLAVTAFFATVLLVAGTARAQETEGPEESPPPRFEMEEVVVTASGIEDEIRTVPKNITVISAEDIAQAPSSNVVDLLSREANVNLQSLYGHDKNAGIDIRGQGETASSNVLVLVDGFRLNPPDLAGPDLSSVPLDQIERIEVLRGAGSVLYGNGAVGGVVNIITKKATQPLQGTASARYGSYNAFDGKASVGGQDGRFGYNLNGGYYGTEGYRENGYYRRTDVSGRVGYDMFDAGTASLSAAYKQDAQGFAGNVPLSDIDDPDLRRQTRSPNDNGSGEDFRLQGVVDAETALWGGFKLNLGYRKRDSDFILGYTPLKTIAQQTSTIDEETASADVGYRYDYALAGREQIFLGGVNTYTSDYVTTRPDQLVRKNSQINSIGVYALNRGAVTDRLTYTIGGRLNTYNGEFRNDDLKDFGGGVERWVNGVPFERDYTNNAVDLGLVYALNDATRFFASYATSFRIPNVDEFALAVDDLKPQEGQHIDAGVRRTIGNGVGEASATLFQVVTKNEIFFDNLQNINDNYDNDTRRRGVELDIRLYPTDSLYLWGNYTYLSARFVGPDTFVPLVPEHTASVGGEWRFHPALLLAVTGSYVSSKFDGNDLTNDRFAKIDAYTVVDGRLTYSWRRLNVFLGVNNMFDTLYETLAFSETYFTMPTRNYYAGVEWSF